MVKENITWGEEHVGDELSLKLGDILGEFHQQVTAAPTQLKSSDRASNFQMSLWLVQKRKAQGTPWAPRLQCEGRTLSASPSGRVDSISRGTVFGRRSTPGRGRQLTIQPGFKRLKGRVEHSYRRGCHTLAAARNKRSAERK